MKALSSADCSYILSLLDSGHSGHEISSITGAGIATISRLCSRYCPYLHKSSGGCPFKLSTTDIHYAIRLIDKRKADNAVEVTKVPQEYNQPTSLSINSLQWLEGHRVEGSGEEEEAIS